MNTKIKEKILRTLILLVPFSVIVVVSNFVFPFVSSKVIIFRVLVYIMIFVWAFLRAETKEYSFRINFFTVLLLLTILWMLAASVFGVDPQKSFWSDFERMGGFIEYLYLFAFVLIASTYFKKAGGWNSFFLSSVIASGVVAVIEVFKLIFNVSDQFRITGQFGNPAYFAIYLLINLFFIPFLLFQNRNRNVKFYLATLFLLELFLLYETGTRGVWLGFLVGAVVSATIAFFSDRGWDVKRNSLIVFTFVIILAGTFFAFRHSNFVERNKLLSRISNISISNEPRLLVWGVSTRGINERPVLGWGADNFSYVFSKYYNPKLSLEEPWFDRAHNSVLDFAVEGGIPLAVLYVALFVFGGYCIYKKQYKNFLWEKIFFGGLLSAYFVSSLFIFELNIFAPLFFFVLLFLARDTREYNLFNVSLFKNWHTYSIIALSFLVFLLTCLYPALANSYAKSALDTRDKSLDESKKLFERASEVSPFYSRSIAFLAYNVSQKMYPSRNFSKGEWNAFTGFVLQELKPLSEQKPLDLKLLVVLGDSYLSLSEYKDAVAIYQRAIQISPNRKDLHDGLGSIFLKSKEFSGAIDEFRKSYELESLFDKGDWRYRFYIDESLKKYIAALIYAGKIDLAEEMMKDNFGSDIVSQDDIISAYVSQNRFHKVEILWKDRVERYPNNYQYLFSLAASYYAEGDIHNAINTLENFAIKFPEFKSDAYNYIKQIQSGKGINVYE